MIKKLHHIILSILFICLLGLVDLRAQDTQHVCVGATSVYSGYGGNTSVMKWYLDGVDDSPEELDDLSGLPESTEYPNYYLSEYSIAWGAIGNHTITMIENNGACDSDPKTLNVKVHALPENPTANSNPILCNDQTGSLTVNIVATVPTDLVLQIRLVDGNSNAIAGINWIDVSRPTHNFENLSEGDYKIQLKYTFNGDDVKGSIVSSVQTYTLTNPPALALSNSITDVTCSGDSDGAVDLTVTGGERNALNFNV